MTKKTAIIILVGIVLIGGFLRFYKLGSSAFDRDEFFELNSSYGYFKTGHFVAWDFGAQKPFSADMQDDSSNERAEVFRWQLAQLYRVFEPSEGVTRALGAFWGVLGILLVYFVAVSMTGSQLIGLIAAFLTAVGYSEILYSRRLRMYAMFFPAYLAFFWAVFKFYESEYRGKIKYFESIFQKTGFNPTYFWPVVIFGLISFDVHVLSAHIAPAVAVYAAFLLLWEIYNKKLTWKNIYLNKYFLSVAAALGGLFIYSLPILGSLHKLIKKNFAFFLNKPNYDFFNQYFADFSYVIIGVILLLFGTLYLAKKMKKTKEAAFIFFSVAVPLAFAVFTWKRDVSHRYIYFLQSFGIILSAVGIYGVVSLVTERFKKYKIIITALLLILFLAAINFKYISSGEVYAKKANSYYPDFRSVFAYVEKNMQPGSVMITRAYRSFYWQNNPVKVYDIKSLGFGAKNCDAQIDAIVKANPNGWVVFPKIDKITLCSAGQKYYESNLIPIKNGSIPSSVLVYRWGQ